jgi:hypothetical protein
MKVALKSLAVFICIAILGLFSINRYYNYKHTEITKLAESEANLKGIIELFGEPMYSSDREGWTLEWFENQFSVSIPPRGKAYVFHPQGTWPNFLLIIVTDGSGRIEQVHPYRT